MIARKRLRKWSMLVGVLLLWFVAGGTAPVAAQERLAPAPGLLLVAGEGMADPRFRETVVLLLRYGEGGVAGVILNRPTSFDTAQLYTAFAVPAECRGPLYYGGPVEPRLLLVLLQSDEPPADSTPVADRLHLTGLPQISGHLPCSGEEGERFRVFSGYAGWSAAQLAGEIARGDWYVEPFDAGVVFSERPETLWRELRVRGKELWI